MRKIVTIAHVTFLEIARDRFFYSFLAFFAILLGASYLASQLSFLASTRIILDFGNTLSLFGLSLFALVQGASIIAKEFDRQTIQLAQSKPLLPIQFLFGKWIGVCGIVLMNLLIFLLLEFTLLKFLGADIGITFYVSFLFVFLQAIMLSAASILFASFTTVTLAVVFGIGILMLGSSTTEFIKSFTKVETVWIRNVLMTVVHIFPSFESFNLGPKLSYDFPLRAREILLPILYALTHSAIYLYVASKLIRKKEY